MLENTSPNDSQRCNNIESMLIERHNAELSSGRNFFESRHGADS